MQITLHPIKISTWSGYFRTPLPRFRAQCDPAQSEWLIFRVKAAYNDNNNNNGDLSCAQTVKIYDSTRRLQCQIIHL